MGEPPTGPLRIKNTFNPTHPGTVIVDDAPELNGALKAVTGARKPVAVVVDLLAADAVAHLRAAGR